MVNAAGLIASKITGQEMRRAPSVPLGPEGEETMRGIRGLEVSDQELREMLDPSGKRPIEELRREYAVEQAKSIPQLMKETGKPLGRAVNK